MYINILSRVYIISNLLKLHFLEFKAIFTFFWLSTNCIFLVWYLLHVKRDTNSGIVFLVKSFRHLHCFIKFILIYRKKWLHFQGYSHKLNISVLKWGYLLIKKLFEDFGPQSYPQVILYLRRKVQWINPVYTLFHVYY